MRCGYGETRIPHAAERVPDRSETDNGRLRLPGARAFLLADVQADGRFSVVTAQPNASVSPVHNRMPLKLF